MFKHVLASGGRRSYETLKYSRLSPPVHGWDPAAPKNLGDPNACMFKHVCSNPGDTRTISMAACATMDDISIARWQANGS